MSCSQRRELINMMDTLNGDNIQCFFVPINLHKDNLKIQYKVTRRKFDFEQKLPYKSCAYDYSDNFIIFDYERNDFEFNSPWVHVIENGVCTYYAPIDALEDSYPIVLVINKYGIPLKVKTVDDFKKLRNDFVLFNKRIEAFSGDKQKIQEEEMYFQYKWYNLKLLEHVYSNIVGILISISAINSDFKIKEMFKAYCDKNNLNKIDEIQEYYQWARLHGIELKDGELEEVLL